MKQLIQTKLFRLLSQSSEENNYISKLEESYDKFALKLLAKLQSETNHADLYYILGFVQLKLAGICDQLSGEEGKKCLKNCL